MEAEFRPARIAKTGNFQVVKLSKKEAEKLKKGEGLNYLGIKAVRLDSKENKLGKYHSEDRLALMQGDILYLSEERCKQLESRAIRPTPHFQETGQRLITKAIPASDSSLGAISSHANIQFAGIKKRASRATSKRKIKGSSGKKMLSEKGSWRIANVAKRARNYRIRSLAAKTILRISQQAQRNLLRKSRNHQRAKKKKADFQKKQARKRRLEDRKWWKRKEERADRREDKEDIRSERKEERIEGEQEKQEGKIKKRTS